MEGRGFDGNDDFLYAGGGGGAGKRPKECGVAQRPEHTAHCSPSFHIDKAAFQSKHRDFTDIAQPQLTHEIRPVGDDCFLGDA